MMQCKKAKSTAVSCTRCAPQSKCCGILGPHGRVKMTNKSSSLFIRLYPDDNGNYDSSRSVKYDFTMAVVTSRPLSIKLTTANN